jgi:hypothetical protein
MSIAIITRPAHHKVDTRWFETREQSASRLVNTGARATPQCRTCATRKAHTDLVAYEPNNVCLIQQRM